MRCPNNASSPIANRDVELVGAGVPADEQTLGHLDAHRRVERKGGVLVGFEDLGGHLGADVVIVGVGAEPNTELAEPAGLAVDNGVLVNAALRTEDPDVYADDDVANAVNPLYHTRIRVEHWANALHGGPAAVRSMLGQQVSYDRAPYFFTDQYDVGMEFAGWFHPAGTTPSLPAVISERGRFIRAVSSDMKGRPPSRRPS